MPLPTISGIMRVSLNWQTAHGIAPVNVLHFGAVSGDETDLRDAFEAAWDDGMIGDVQQDWTITTITVTKLDGSSAGVILPTAAHGSLSGGDFINQACAVVSLYTGQRGSRGRGRVYLGPIAESVLVGGRLNSRATISGSWEAFRVAMAAADFPLVVASYVHADAHPVSHINCSVVAGTQRRRNDQIR